MKANFAVSADRRFWVPSARKLFAVDPYITHVLEREGRLGEYEDISCAPLRRTTRHEFQTDHDFVDARFRKYMPVLVERLERLHGLNLGQGFWNKALALSLLRHIVFCYDIFQVCEEALDPAEHDFRVLDRAHYYIPVTFDDHRDFYQNTDFGREQLFSIYCYLFSASAPASVSEVRLPRKKAAPIGLWQRLTAGGLLRKVLRRVLERLVALRQPKVGILVGYFAPKYFNRLMLASLGKIQRVPLPTLRGGGDPVCMDKRQFLAVAEGNSDRFDKYFFATLAASMPRSFVEDFDTRRIQLCRYFDRYPKLEWVVDEAWIGHEDSALALAILRARGIRHLCNEHNYLAHPFLGNSLKYQFPLVDEFVTLGWEDTSVPNLIRGASLFPWMAENGIARTDIRVLLILGCPLMRPPEISAAYGDAGGHGAQSYFEKTGRFLTGLTSDVLRETYIRAYPAQKTAGWLVWDQRRELAPFVQQVRAYDDSTVSGRDLMARAGLVIVNYLSTSHLESIIADIPTVILWNADSNFFDAKHERFFDRLIACGICHTDPDEAARFVGRIADDPRSWWYSPKVREARRGFLEENIGKPETMIDYLLCKLN